MRCQSCQKFVSMENGEPEVNDEELTSGSVFFSVRLTRNCADCGDELKEASFDHAQDHQAELDAHMAEKHEGEDADFELEIGDSEAGESGGGRYHKNMIDVHVGYSIRCNLCDEAVLEGEFADSIAASGFEEI